MTNSGGRKGLPTATPFSPLLMIIILIKMLTFVFFGIFYSLEVPYSPVASGKFSDFFWFLASGQFKKFDYGNLALVAITLFAIEMILSLIIWVGKLSYAIKAASK